MAYQLGCSSWCTAGSERSTVSGSTRTQAELSGDVWDSGEQFAAFSEQRLMPVIMALGITSQPTVEIYPAYATFAPNPK